MKRLVSLLLSTAFASLVPCAGAQSVTITTSDVTVTTSDDPVGGAVETTEDVLGGVSQPGSSGDSSDGLGDTAGDAADSGTASAGASPGKAFRTRFDRLPPRLERLLERIELGRNVRANLRRLEQALGSASIRERARVLRVLNTEIRRLRTDGVSPTERRRIERLIRTRAALTALSGPTPTSAATATSAVADAATGTSGTAVAPGAGPRVGAGVLRAFVARMAPPRGATPPSGGAVGPPGPPAAPDEGGEGAFPLTQVLVALCAVLLVIAGGLAIREDVSR